jgi:hypothetical protein
MIVAATKAAVKRTNFNAIRNKREYRNLNKNHDINDP